MQESKSLHQLCHKVFDWFGWNLVYVSHLLVWWASYSFYLVRLIFKRENPVYVILFKKKSFKLGMMIEIATLYILMPVWMSLTFVHGHSCMRNQKLLWPYYHKCLYRFGWKFSLLPQPVSLLTLVPNLFCAIHIPGREFFLCYSTK